MTALESIHAAIYHDQLWSSLGSRSCVLLDAMGSLMETPRLLHPAGWCPAHPAGPSCIEELLALIGYTLNYATS